MIFLADAPLESGCSGLDALYVSLNSPVVTLDSLRILYAGGADAHLQVIGDLGCDIGGNVECTVKCTDPGDPVFTWDPATGDITSGFNGQGPVVLAVDFLPTELPREASEEFAATLNRFAADIGRADYSVPFEDLDLPPRRFHVGIVAGSRAG